MAATKNSKFGICKYPVGFARTRRCLRFIVAVCIHEHCKRPRVAMMYRGLCTLDETGYYCLTCCLRIMFNRDVQHTSRR